MDRKTLRVFIVFIICAYSLNLYGGNDVELRVQSTGATMRSYDLSFTPNGNYFFTTAGPSLQLWDVNTGKLVQTYSEQAKDIVDDMLFFAACSPDGKTVISVFPMGIETPTRLLFWDVQSSKLLKTVTIDPGQNSVAYSNDGRFIAVTCGGNFSLLDAITGNTLQKCKWEDGITNASFSSDNKHVLLNNLHKVAVFEIATGKTVNLPLITKSDNNLNWTGQQIKDAMFAASNKNILVSSFSYDLKFTFLTVYDYVNNKVVDRIKINEITTQLAFSADGKFALVANQGNDSSIVLFDVFKGKEIKTLKGRKTWVDNIIFSPDGNNAISCDRGTYTYWDIKNGYEIRSFSGHGSGYNSASFSNDGTKILGDLCLWDISSGKIVRNFIDKSWGIYSSAISPNANQVVSIASYLGPVTLWNVESGQAIRELKGLSNGFDGDFAATVAFSKDGSQVLAHLMGYNAVGNFASWSTSSGNLAGFFSAYSSYNIAFSPDRKYVINIQSYNGNPVLIDATTGRVVRSFIATTDFSAGMECGAFSEDGKYAITGSSDGTSKLWDAVTGKEMRLFSKHTSYVSSVAISPDKKFAVTGARDRLIFLWDLTTGQKIKTLTGHEGWIQSLEFSPDSKKLLSCSNDGTMRIWDIATGQFVAFMNHENKKDWLIFTNDGYWDASINGGELVAMTKGLNNWNIDQFAVKNNRPDIILQRLDCTNKELIAHYYNQYQKRLKRNGLTESQLSGEYQVPTVKITGAEQIEKFVNLKFKVSDEKFNLKKYSIYVNDIPIYGSQGKPVNTKIAEFTEKVELCAGNNKIEVSCMNNNGTESYRALTYATYNEPVKKDVYLLAFGVSKYTNSSYNLAFADKDAFDLEKTIQSLKGKGFENVYTKVLTNEQVTPEAIKASKDFVKNAKSDDTFILFIAGHGMHDNDADATYYYLTSNADITNLKGTAADFETIEDLLQGIPPRNKLFLMDACESGEIDEEDQGQMIAAATGAGIASRGFKSTTPVIASEAKQSSSKRSYLYQKDRYIYNDLVRRSGAIVFSSSKGGELSYERSDIENGLFTEYIMKAITTTEADKDGNGTVSTDELREYVSARVAKASGNMQHPTVDRDNIFQKFGLKIN